MIAYSIAFLLFGSLSYLYVKDTKQMIRFKEESGIVKESIFELKFQSSQLLGRWDTRIDDIEAHKDYYKMSNVAIRCEVKTKQDNIIWQGDIDLNLHKDKFTELANNIDKSIRVEVDGRVVLTSSNGDTQMWTVDTEYETVKNRNDRLDNFFKNHKS